MQRSSSAVRREVAAAADPRFDPSLARTHRGSPWRSVALAVGLLLGGVALYALAWLCLTGHLGTSDEDLARGYGFAALGSLTFIPGFYHSRIAYYTFRQYKGFSYDQIPTV